MIGLQNYFWDSSNEGSYKYAPYFLSLSLWARKKCPVCGFESLFPVYGLFETVRRQLVLMARESDTEFICLFLNYVFGNLGSVRHCEGFRMQTINLKYVILIENAPFLPRVSTLNNINENISEINVLFRKIDVAERCTYNNAHWFVLTSFLCVLYLRWTKIVLKRELLMWRFLTSWWLREISKYTSGMLFVLILLYLNLFYNFALNINIFVFFLKFSSYLCLDKYKITYVGGFWLKFLMFTNWLECIYIHSCSVISAF